jgi:diguanylate cyclase (GGDEF)-like protein/PAS domain S-box-containing protein
MRIKAKFILSHVLAAVVPLMVLAGTTYTMVQHEVDAKVGDELMATSADAIAELEQEFAAVVRPLAEMSQRLAPRLAAAGDSALAGAELHRLQDRHPDIAVVMLLGPEGAVVAASRPELVGLNLSGHPQVRAARTGHAAPGPVEFQPFSGRKGFPVALPVRHDESSDKVLGILLAVVEWRPFEAALTHVRVYGSGHDDQHRLMLAQRDDGAVLFAEPARPLGGEATATLAELGHGRMMRTEVEVDAAPFLASSSHTHAAAGLPNPGWVAYALVNKRAAYDSVSALGEAAAVVALGAAVVTLLLGYALASHMVRPIEAITRAFGRMGDGTLPTVFDIKQRDDEIGDMAGVLRAFRDNVVDMAKLSRAVDQSPAAVMITDTNGSIDYVNARFLTSTGYCREEVVGASAAALGVLGAASEGFAAIRQQVLQNGEWRGEVQCRRKDASQFSEHVWVSSIHDGRGLTHFVAVKEDLSARKQYEEELSHQANYDSLTDLPNRILALDLLRQTIHEAQRCNTMAGVVMVDIDCLRTLNDTMGHDAGDDLLRQAAARLTNCFGDGDWVARMGGDEFVVVLAGIATTIEADHAAQRITEAFTLPFLIGDRDVVVGASLGIALYPTDGSDPHVLIRNADVALHLAKDSGRNGRRFFTVELHEQAVRKLTIESELRQALDRDELSLVYQPLVECRSGEIVAAEALLRWRNGELGQVSPDAFVPVAEETGLVVPIGEWIVGTVCRDMRNWDRMGGPPLRVAINVSARQLEGWDFVHLVADRLQANAIAPHRLEIEVTERLLLHRDAHTRAVLGELKAMGVRLSIDDFGTGYSAMSYLTAFPFDVLKIDRSFVNAVHTSRQDAALAQAIIAMAHSLDLEVVAEGVEDEVHVDFMRRNGAEFMQGFYFSPPLPPEQFFLLAGGKVDRAAYPVAKEKAHPRLRVVGLGEDPDPATCATR